MSDDRPAWPTFDPQAPANLLPAPEHSTGPTMSFDDVLRAIKGRRKRQHVTDSVTAPPETFWRDLTTEQRGQLAEIGGEFESAAAAFAAAADRVKREAPTAPSGAANEALIRFTSFLLDAPANPGDGPSNAGAWKRSGAAALLAPYRIRRAV